MKTHYSLPFTVSVLMLSVASAATVIKPVGVTSTINGNAGSSVNYLLNDNTGYTTEAPLQRPVGVSVTLPSGTDLTDALATLHARSGSAHAESWTNFTSVGNPVFVFDLGAGNTDISSILLWQYGNSGGVNDTKNFRVILHTEAEGNTFDFTSESADLTDDASGMGAGVLTASNVAQQFSFSSAQSVRYVALRIDTNYGGNRYGLGEIRFASTSPTDPDPDLDTDGDGLPDIVETNTGVYVSATDTGTDPNNANTDGDRIKDGAEVRRGNNPLNPNDFPNLPNVIFIMADDLGIGELGAYGQTKILTPRIDQLASEGMCLDDFYAPCAVCAPTRAMLLTGKHAGQAAIRNNTEVGEYQKPLPANAFTLGHLMQNAGYATSCIGKWGVGGPGSSGEPYKQGFDHFFGYLGQKQAHYYYPQRLWRNTEKVYYSPTLAAANGTTVEIPGANNEIGFIKSNDGNVHSHDAMTKEAMEWITAHKDEAFFMYLCYPIPHTSIQPPGHIDDLTDADGIVIDNNVRTSVDEFYPVNLGTGQRPFGSPISHGGTWSYTSTPDKRHEYAAMITAMDRDVGRINDLLVSLNLDENTLVIFTSDNGTTWIGEVDHAYFESVGPYRGLKEEIYDGGVRTPFIAWWPGHVAATAEHIKLLGNLDDIMATLAELTQTPCPSDTTGRSILPTLLGYPETQEPKPYIYHEFKDKNALVGGAFHWTRAIRRGDWKLHRYTKISNSAVSYGLYNLASDIGESNNVYAANPEIAAELERLMDAAHTPSKAYFRGSDELPNSTPGIKADMSYGALGRRLNGTGYGLSGLLEEITTKAIFKTTIDTAGGSTRNGTFLFGEGSNTADFIQVEINDDSNILRITHGADTTSTALSGNRPFDLEVTWDPATSTVSVIQAGESLSLALTNPPAVVDHVAYSVDTSITDFSPVTVSLDASVVPFQLTQKFKSGVLTYSYQKPSGSSVYSLEESFDLINWHQATPFYEQQFNRFGEIQDVIFQPQLSDPTTPEPQAIFHRLRLEPEG